MSVAAPYGKTKSPSPLAIELALARLNLAALKAKRGVQPSQQEISAAELLRDYFSKTLQVLRRSNEPIAAGQILTSRAKEALQRTLASLPPRTKAMFDEVDPDVLDSIVKVLVTLTARGRLEAQAASNLIEALGKLFAAGRDKLPVSPLSEMARHVGAS